MHILGIRDYGRNGRKRKVLPVDKFITSWAHLVLVVPDGRILVQRRHQTNGAGLPWCASMSSLLTKEDLRAGDVLRHRLMAAFELDHKKLDNIKHLFVHRMKEENKTVYVFMTKMNSTTKLRCSAKTEIISWPFELLIKTIKKDRDNFTDITRAIYNIIEESQLTEGV